MYDCTRTLYPIIYLTINNKVTFEMNEMLLHT